MRRLVPSAFGSLRLADFGGARQRHRLPLSPHEAKLRAWQQLRPRQNANHHVTLDPGRTTLGWLQVLRGLSQKIIEGGFESLFTPSKLELINFGSNFVFVRYSPDIFGWSEAKQLSSIMKLHCTGRSHGPPSTIKIWIIIFGSNSSHGSLLIFITTWLIKHLVKQYSIWSVQC